MILVITNCKEGEKMVSWIMSHGEWLSLMVIMLGGLGFILKCFLFCHSQSVRQSKRTDELMTATNNQIATTNQRTDELHKEFYELLKEMRKKK